MKFEQDEVELTGGVRHGRTLGGPVAIRIGNTEWPKWETVMSPDPVDAEILAAQARSAPLTRPRPGHADLAGMQKYGHDDARAILERASARETAARVALGEIARRLLRQVLGAEIVSHVVALGAARAPDELRARAAGLRADRRRPGALPRRGRQRGHAGRGRRRAPRRRHARRRRRGRRPTGCRPALAATCTGTGDWTAGSPGADEHPGDQGRRGRRRLRHRDAPRSRKPTTRSRAPPTASGGPPTGLAASRAA